MKCFYIRLSALLFLVTSSAIAGWQVASPKKMAPSNPFFQAGVQTDTTFTPYKADAFPNQFAHLGKPANLYAISVSGSVKENLERIMDRYHWRVVWLAPYDYNFDGRVTGSSLPNVVDKLLQPFPLQAVLYLSNRTMTVVPRKV